MRRKHMLENDPRGLTVAVEALVAQQMTKKNDVHHPMRLALVLQFWDGDAMEAFRLARLLADLEPEPRNDVMFVLARRRDYGESDAALDEAEAVLQKKFPVLSMVSPRAGVGHPDGCYAIWSGVMEELTSLYYDGILPFDNVFTFEPDGAPCRRDWIDSLKRTHAQNLAAGARVTGAPMTQGFNTCASPPHVNGCLCMHVSCWADHPSMHYCPPGAAWDVVHGLVLLQELGSFRPIANLYGAQAVSTAVFETLAREHCWLSNVKDDSAFFLAERMIEK